MMPGGFIGGMGAPGSRISHQLDEAKELKTHVIEACAFALVLDIVIALILTDVLLFGWYSVPTLFVASGIGVTVWFCAKKLRLHPMNTFYVTAFIAVMSLTAGLSMGQVIWRWVLGDEWRQLIMLVFHPLVLIPYFVYLAALMVWVFALWFKRGILAGVTIAIAVVGWGFYCVSNDSDIPMLIAQVAGRVRYLAIPFTWPPIVACVLLAMVTAKNLLFPYLDLTAKPIELSDFHGKLGRLLIAPGLLAMPKSAQPSRTMRCTVARNGGQQTKLYDFPDKPEFIKFARLVIADAKNFSWPVANKCGLERVEYERHVRDYLMDMGEIEWNDATNHKKGINVKPECLDTLLAVVDEYEAQEAQAG